MNRYALAIVYMLRLVVLAASTSVTIHSVGSLRDTGYLRCGSKVTFVCSIPSYKYKMKWLMDSDKVAECVTTNCVQYPPYKVENIELSSNTSNGVFNMTINPVTLKADGRKIKCRHGSESDQLKLAVKVFPTKITTEIVESKDDNKCNMIKLTAKTGCVFQSSAITMQWYYYEEGHAPQLYTRMSPIEAIDFSVCSSGPCGGNGVVKLSSTLSIPDEQNGNGYFFQIAIRHKDTGDIILVNYTRSYKIKELTSEIDKETYLPAVVIVVGSCTYTVVSLLLLFIAAIFVALGVKGKLPLIFLRRLGQFTNYITTLIAPAIVSTENKNKHSTKRARNASGAGSSENKFLVDSDETKGRGKQ